MNYFIHSPWHYNPFRALVCRGILDLGVIGGQCGFESGTFVMEAVPTTASPQHVGNMSYTAKKYNPNIKKKLMNV